jgi:hypothetical protein
MKKTVNAYIAIFAITILGAMASFTIVQIATDVAFADEFSAVEYALYLNN